MGPCAIDDLATAELQMARRRDARFVHGRGHVVTVRRCRFLEEAGCASVCVNACKMPTQRFFNEDMGVAMRMVPDYETLQCSFQFGVAPTEADEAEARSAPCFGACPMAPVTPAALRCVGMGGEQTDSVAAALPDDDVARLWIERSWVT